MIWLYCCRDMLVVNDVSACSTSNYERYPIGSRLQATSTKAMTVDSMVLHAYKNCVAITRIFMIITPVTALHVKCTITQSSLQYYVVSEFERNQTPPP